jgi:hypothetical protein
MKLTELEPEFITYKETPVDPEVFVNGVKSPSGVQVSHHVVSTLAESDGIMFLCPKCFAENGGAVGTHAVLCWFEGKVPDYASPKPGRWNPTGTGFADLSFVPGAKSHSVLLLSGCAWHGFITNGEATI